MTTVRALGPGNCGSIPGRVKRYCAQGNVNLRSVWNRVCVLGKLVPLRPLRNSAYLMAPEGSLSCSQQPATCPLVMSQMKSVQAVPLCPVFVISGVRVTASWRVCGSQAWKVELNVLDKQSRTSDKRWSSSTGVERVANSLHRQ